MYNILLRSIFLGLLSNYQTHTVFNFKKRLIVNEHMYSQFWRLITARGSNTILVTIGPTKVKACKSVLFTDSIVVQTISFGDSRDICGPERTRFRS